MFAVIWVMEYYEEKIDDYLQRINMKVFRDFDRAKEFYEEVCENELEKNDDFAILIDCFAFKGHPYRFGD